MPSVSIIIPTHNGRAQLAACIASIRSFTKTPYEIIVVDNGSVDGTTDFCLAEQLMCSSNPKNRGYPAACNQGMKAAGGDAILLLNDDTVVSFRWLENMLDCLYSAPDVGVVGPMANVADGAQRSGVRYESLEEFHRLAETLNRPDPSRWATVNQLVGFCMLIRREVLERVGLLDERFSPGHYEDDDYCRRVRAAGYRLMLAGDTHIHHEGSLSFRRLGDEALRRLLERNRRLFVRKWGSEPEGASI